MFLTLIMYLAMIILAFALPVVVSAILLFLGVKLAKVEETFQRCILLSTVWVIISVLIIILYGLIIIGTTTRPVFILICFAAMNSYVLIIKFSLIQDVFRLSFEKTFLVAWPSISLFAIILMAADRALYHFYG